MVLFFPFRHEMFTFLMGRDIMYEYIACICSLFFFLFFSDEGRHQGRAWYSLVEYFIYVANDLALVLAFHCSVRRESFVSVDLISNWYEVLVSLFLGGRHGAEQGLGVLNMVMILEV